MKQISKIIECVKLANKSQSFSFTNKTNTRIFIELLAKIRINEFI